MRGAEGSRDSSGVMVRGQNASPAISSSATPASDVKSGGAGRGRDDGQKRRVEDAVQTGRSPRSHNDKDNGNGNSKDIYSVNNHDSQRRGAINGRTNTDNGGGAGGRHGEPRPDGRPEYHHQALHSRHIDQRHAVERKPMATATGGRRRRQETGEKKNERMPPPPPPPPPSAGIGEIATGRAPSHGYEDGIGDSTATGTGDVDTRNARGDGGRGSSRADDAARRAAALGCLRSRGRIAPASSGVGAGAGVGAGLGRRPASPAVSVSASSSVGEQYGSSFEEDTEGSSSYSVGNASEGLGVDAASSSAVMMAVAGVEGGATVVTPKSVARIESSPISGVGALSSTRSRSGSGRFGKGGGVGGVGATGTTAAVVGRDAVQATPSCGDGYQKRRGEASTAAVCVTPGGSRGSGSSSASRLDFTSPPPSSSANQDSGSRSVRSRSGSRSGSGSGYPDVPSGLAELSFAKGSGGGGGGGMASPSSGRVSDTLWMLSEVSVAPAAPVGVVAAALDTEAGRLDGAATSEPRRPALPSSSSLQHAQDQAVPHATVARLAGGRIEGVTVVDTGIGFDTQQSLLPINSGGSIAEGREVTTPSRALGSRRRDDGNSGKGDVLGHSEIGDGAEEVAWCGDRSEGSRMQCVRELLLHSSEAQASVYI